SGVLVRGLSLEDLAHKKELFESIPENQRGNFKDNHVLIGVEMARRFNLREGDVLTLISPKPKNTPFGSIPRSRSYRVGGVFDVGMFEYNNNFVFMPLEAAQKFFEIPQMVSMLEIVTTDPQKIDKIKGEIERRLGEDFMVRDW